MRILALDTASATGWCYGDTAEPNASLEYGTQKFKVHDKELGPFAVDFDFWLDELIDRARPELIAFEAPILRIGGPRPMTSVAGARLMMGLTWHVEFRAAKWDIKCRECDLQRVKQFWTGDGRAKKDQMVRMAEIYGYKPQDDNQADALAIFHYAAQLVGARGLAASASIGPLGAKGGKR